MDVTYVLRCVNVFDSFDGFGAIGQGTHDFVIRRYGWIRDVFVLESRCVAESVAPGFFDVTFVSAVVFR